MDKKYLSVIESIKDLVQTNPDRVLITYIDDRTLQPIPLTAEKLYQKACGIAHYLTNDLKLNPGDHVVLTYPQGLEFVEAFVGCIFAGVVPAPVSPPMPVKTEMGFPNYTNIVQDSQAKAHLTCTRYTQSRSFGKITEILKQVNQLKEIPWIETDTIENHHFDPVTVDAHDTAFLQYTSGSTRAPRGVCITFQNIFVQLEFLRKKLALTPETITLFWMPHYHDFSLIGGILNTLYQNHHLVLFSPMLFMKKPALWFELAHQFRATHLTGPNFALNYMTERTTPEERKSWDLSCVKKVVCSAEPIQPQTVRRFYETFSESKLSANTFSAAYGMAEHTIAVSLNGHKTLNIKKSTLSGIETDHEEIELMSSGTVGEDIKVLIINPENNQEVPNGEVGEIWIQSNHIGNGYYNNPEQTSYKFKNKLSNREGFWMRSGDLGLFVGEELICTGRMDDMIIVNGQNIYPQDIEEMAMESSPYVRAGRVIAFGKEVDNQMTLHVVVEITSDEPEKDILQSITQTTREALFRQLGLSTCQIIYTHKGIIPKTTSGKLQRKKCKKMWTENLIPTIKLDAGYL